MDNKPGSLPRAASGRSWPHAASLSSCPTILDASSSSLCLDSHLSKAVNKEPFLPCGTAVRIKRVNPGVLGAGTYAVNQGCFTPGSGTLSTVLSPLPPPAPPHHPITTRDPQAPFLLILALSRLLEKGGGCTSFCFPGPRSHLPCTAWRFPAGLPAAQLPITAREALLVSKPDADALLCEDPRGTPRLLPTAQPLQPSSGHCLCLCSTCSPGADTPQASHLWHFVQHPPCVETFLDSLHSPGLEISLGWSLPCKTLRPP